MTNEQKEAFIQKIYEKNMRLVFDIGYAQGTVAAVMGLLEAEPIDKDAIKELLLPILEIVV